MRKAVIIDDEKEFCLLFKNYLSRKGFEVSVFYSLDEGMKGIDDCQPSIVFLDNNLPDGLGWEKLPDLHEKYPSLKIHLLSGYNYITTTNHLTSRIRYWKKPINLTELDYFIK